LSPAGASLPIRFRRFSTPRADFAVFVMPGLVPGIHVFFFCEIKTWMAGTKPGHDELDEE